MPSISFIRFKKYKNALMLCLSLVAVQLANAQEAKSGTPCEPSTNTSTQLQASERQESLVINEVVAKSNDPDLYAGADWIEFHNLASSQICLRDYSIQLNDLPAVTLAETSLASGDYFTVAASTAPDRPGALPFTLKKQGALTLYYKDKQIDRVQWQAEDVKRSFSYGRLEGELRTLFPTPNSKNIGFTLFDPNKVAQIKIRISDKSLKDLHRKSLLEKWYKVDITVNGAKLSQAALATKGSSTLRHITELTPGNRSYGRFSFKVDFNRYKDQKFMGLDRLHLNSGYGDPTHMRDAIAYQAMKTVGMPASEFAYAEVWINDRHMGLYHMIEPIDGEYVEKYFPEDSQKDLKGDLYKAFTSLKWEQGQPLRYYTRGKYPQLKLKTNESTIGTPEEGKALMAFLKSLNAGSIEHVDTDLMPRYIAAMTLISNYDSYFANLGNYYLYEQRSKNKFTMLPWDFNLALGRVIKEGKPCEDDTVLINHPTIAAIEDRPMIARILERDDLRKAYHDHLRTLLDNFFNPKDIRTFVEQKQALINDYVKKDSTRFYSYLEWKKSFNEVVIGTNDEFGRAGPLLPFVDARYNNVKKQLSGELNAGSISSGPCPKTP